MQNVLFLCAENAARSILAEALLRHWGEGQLTAFSAGSCPADAPHPMALRLLEERGVSTESLRSKSWEEFANPQAPVMDLVITLCDTAGDEAVAALSGAPMHAHWGLPDPEAAIGDETALQAAFNAVFEQLEQHIAQLVTIPFADRDPKSVRADLDSIAETA